MPIQNRMTTRPDFIQDYDILGLQQRRQSALTQQPTEDDMKGLYLEIIDKDEPDAFDLMLARMRRAGSEMESDKFMQLMAPQIATLGPNATIAELARALMAQGVYDEQPRSRQAAWNALALEKQYREEHASWRLRQPHAPAYRM